LRQTFIGGFEVGNKRPPEQQKQQCNCSLTVARAGAGDKSMGIMPKLFEMEMDSKCRGQILQIKLGISRQ
jgi:hypothetical protein